ncbi:MAG: hypothetical protein LIP12_04735 [Clostridiales bacterium]|nr:hypothetical protein [Clostridiales bacterium]
MGTFVNTYIGKNSKIPEEKIPEFEKRLEKLFQAGGMMEIEKVSLLGIDTCTIRKARMHEKGMDFYYNYFEEDCWENVGYSTKKHHVWSNKVGWREFNITVTAAYVLETLYTDGAAAVFVNGDFIEEEIYTGWLNYLFEEEFRTKNRNPWLLFDDLEHLPEQEEYINHMDWNSFAGTPEGMAGCTEIYAVQNGIDAMIQWHDDLLKQAGVPLTDHEHSFNFFSITRLIVNGIRSYGAKSGLPKDQQFIRICANLKAFYQEPEMGLSEFEQKYELDDGQKALFLCLFLMDLPVIALKTIAELYDKDFRELWDEFRNVFRDSKRVFPMQLQDPPAEKISTQKLFQRKPDDMIYYWEKDGDFQLSDSLKKWFGRLRKKYDKIMKSGVSVQNLLKWILELMQYAQEEYYNIFTFAEFFEETVNHLTDQRYLALWKLYEGMLYDHELEEAGKVIFVPDGPEYANRGLHSSSGKEPRHRLEYSWCVTDKEKRENNARVTLRRYMALVANVKLRKNVFGF